MNVCDFYQKSNSAISVFSICKSEAFDKMHSTFCMHMYGCDLWNLNGSGVQKLYIAWSKVKRCIWKLPNPIYIEDSDIYILI